MKILKIRNRNSKMIFISDIIISTWQLVHKISWSNSGATVEQTIEARFFIVILCVVVQTLNEEPRKWCSWIIMVPNRCARSSNQIHPHPLPTPPTATPPHSASHRPGRSTGLATARSIFQPFGIHRHWSQYNSLNCLDWFLRIKVKIPPHSHWAKCASQRSIKTFPLYFKNNIYS